MKTQTRIEKKGYKVSYNVTNKNGRLELVSVVATRGAKKIIAKNITQLLKKI